MSNDSLKVKQSMTSSVKDYISPRYVDKMCIAFIQSILQEDMVGVEQIIPNIISSKLIELNTRGVHNLFMQIGCEQSDLNVNCVNTKHKIKVVAFKADDKDTIKKIKNKVKTLLHMECNSVFIVNTKELVIKVSQLVFNDNGVHFLNYAQPNKYASVHYKIGQYRNFISKNKVSMEDVLLDSGMVLELYGIRGSSDIDYFVDDNTKIKQCDEKFDNHDDELQYHDESKLEMINNPKYYFYFNGLKFVSFNQVYRMKQNRGDIKDINDCKMMEALIEKDWFKAVISKAKQEFYYVGIKTLKIFRFYKIARYIYRRINNE